MENGLGSSCIANDERWSLAGATAVVTGGTKGIGYAIVEELARFGAAIHTCSRNEAELNKCLKEWGAKSFKVTGSVCDVSCQADREKLMEDVKSTFGGKLSILVNNAGTGFVKPMVAITPDEYKFMMSTNLESAFHLTQLAHPLLKASGAGTIVNVSSLAGIVGIDNITIYGATKAALNQLTRSLACEWAKDNIRTNCVAPGSVRTPLMEPLLAIEEFVAKETYRIPLGRVAESEEVSAVVAFLCLPAACYINGQVICVDGGATADPRLLLFYLPPVRIRERERARGTKFCFYFLVCTSIMAEICCGVETAALKSCEPGSRAARRRRMEIRRLSFVAGVEAPAVEDEPSEKRQRMDGGSSSGSAEKSGTTPGGSPSLEPPIMASAELGTSGRRPRFGMAAVRGRRRDMEDAVSIRPDFVRRDDGVSARHHFFGVFDGHGCSHVR
ncbi:unnamed protein product [Musa acuminata subsp. burmannicoides]